MQRKSNLIYEKVGRVIRLESESNTCILDEYLESGPRFADFW